MLSAAAMANVVALNFCYDVPVKLYSVQLLLEALIIAAPDLRQVARLFLSDAQPLFRRRWAVRTAMVLAVLFVGFQLGASLWASAAQRRTFSRRALRFAASGVSTS